jgi:hypothetical protein
MDDRETERLIKAIMDDPEKQRWWHVSFCALSIIGLPANQQDVFLRFLLKDWFSDVPEELPSPNDTAQAFAAYAVKFLLRALVDDGSDGNRMRFAKTTA